MWCLRPNDRHGRIAAQAGNHRAEPLPTDLVTVVYMDSNNIPVTASASIGIQGLSSGPSDVDAIRNNLSAASGPKVTARASGGLRYYVDVGSLARSESSPPNCTGSAGGASWTGRRFLGHLVAGLVVLAGTCNGATLDRLRQDTRQAKRIGHRRST